MKRFLIVLMVVGLVVGTVVTAEAKTKKKRAPRVQRTVEEKYEGPFVAQVTGCDSLGRHWGCLSVMPQRGESTFTAEVSDDHGLPVFVEVRADLDGVYNNLDVIATFCGETNEPISVPRGIEFHIWVGNSWPGSAVHPDCPAIPTTGTISVTLSNLP